VPFCVVPRELETDLLGVLRVHYAADPEMTVIVDRRTAERRRPPLRRVEDEHRVLRDRRRRPAGGSLPPLYGETGAPVAE
jgi:hypothetical protein